MKPIPGRYSRYATNRDFKVYFGLDPVAKWPRTALPEQTIFGWTIWVEASRPRATGMRWLKSSTHRVMTRCPKCGKIFSAGRIQQHIKVHLNEQLVENVVRIDEELLSLNNLKKGTR